MNPPTVGLPIDRKMVISPHLALSVTVATKFDIHLLQSHMNEASEFVRKCRQENKPVLDVCGDRGDLYFLLRACAREKLCLHS
jgi:hypothetical protein